MIDFLTSFCGPMRLTFQSATFTIEKYRNFGKLIEIILPKLLKPELTYDSQLTYGLVFSVTGSLGFILIVAP